MRKRKQVEDQAAKQKQANRARTLLSLGVLLFASLCLLFLSFNNWSATNSIKAHNLAIQKDRSAAEQYMALAKINAAKKAEAAAKAHMEAEMAAKAESERLVAAAKQTEPTATTATSCAVKSPAALTVVINKKHCFSPLDWTPGDLANVGGYPLRSEAANQMTAMMNAANAAGNGFGISSAYRSYQNQQTVYNNWVQVNGNVSAADTVSARPGYSEHQTGLAADLKTDGCALECFSGTGAYTWLTQHAAEYGYINRYPSGLSDITGYAPEPWHWRYVGVATAKDMKAKGIQTLEQYFGITGGSY